MQSETSAPQYEQALTLAESGRYELALERMLDYLKISPADGKALNDAGTILFCMRRGAEAIAYFEKAMELCSGDELTQVYWNLCEAYIQDGLPAKAAELFGPMRHQGLLNADLLNRTAEAFLQQNDLGGAAEALVLSLTLYPDQEVLKPMLEIIRRHRTKVAIFADAETAILYAAQGALERRLPVETFIRAPVEIVAEKMRQAGLVIFAGMTNALVQSSSVAKAGKVIVLLDEADLYHAGIAQINWAAADMVLAAASPEAVEDFSGRTALRNITRVQFVPEAQPHMGQEKKRGKRLAALGPWNFRQNPMFLLQCFQKLHYLDADMRLHLAGEFEDAGLERYMKSAAEAMNLDTVIFFDGPVKNPGKWLRDKHFMVSTCIDQSALAGIWLGMANGLKPVVHRFDGVEAYFDESHVFTLAEDFCRLVQSDAFEPTAYRTVAQEQFERTGAARKIHSLVCRMEHRHVQQSPLMQSTASYPVIVPAKPAAQDEPLQTPKAQSISTLAEQALSAARALKEIMHQPASSGANDCVRRPSQPDMSRVGSEGLSVEPFIEAEFPAVPFASRT